LAGSAFFFVLGVLPFFEGVESGVDGGSEEGTGDDEVSDTGIEPLPNTESSEVGAGGWRLALAFDLPFFIVVGVDDGGTSAGSVGAFAVCVGVAELTFSPAGV
jgi:hypothetical protein